jgi:hypothetical protein
MPRRGVRFKWTPPKSGISIWNIANARAVRIDAMDNLPISMLLLLRYLSTSMAMRTNEAVNHMVTHRIENAPSGR